VIGTRLRRLSMTSNACIAVAFREQGWAARPRGETGRLQQLSPAVARSHASERVNVRASRLSL